MYRFFGASHINIDAQKGQKRFLASAFDRNFVNIFLRNKDEYVLREANINKIFVPKFYHDRASRNFLKHLKFVKRHEADLSNKFGEPSTFGTVFYEYHKNNINSRANHILNADDNEFFFPYKWHKTFGYAIYGFSFVFKNAPDKINNILKPSIGLINDFANNNTEEIDNTLNRNTFFDEKAFNQKVAEFKAIPKKEFINESFFLYDKSNTIKRTFITALNKELSIYGSFSYFSGKKKQKI